MKITITRRSKVGFGYTASCIQGKHGLYVPEPDRPVHVGTVKTVSKQVDNDRTLKSFSSGGTCYSQAWFVKHAGKWYRIVDNGSMENNPIRLLDTCPDFYEDDKYYNSQLHVDVEEI